MRDRHIDSQPTQIVDRVEFCTLLHAKLHWIAISDTPYRKDKLDSCHPRR